MTAPQATVSPSSCTPISNSSPVGVLTFSSVSSALSRKFESVPNRRSSRGGGLDLNPLGARGEEGSGEGEEGRPAAGEAERDAGGERRCECRSKNSSL